MANTWKLKVDIKKKKTGTVPIFVQYDEARLEFKLYDDAKLMNLDSYSSVEFTHRQPSGKVTVSDGVIELDEKGDKIIAYDYYGSEMSEVGFVDVSFSLFDENNNKASMQPFRIQIVTDLRDLVINRANPEYGKLQEYTVELETLKSTMETKIQETDKATLDAATIVEEGTELFEVVNLLKDETSQLKTETETVKDDTLIVKNETVQAKDDAIVAKDEAIVATLETIAEKEATEAVRLATESVKNNTDQSRIAAETATAKANQWIYSSDYNASTAYKTNNTITYNGEGYIAKKNVTGVAPTGQLNDPNWALIARKGIDGTGTVTRHKEVFTSTENQTVFNLNTSYERNNNKIDVTVGNVPQYSPNNFTETTATSITFTEGLPAGLEVVVLIWKQ